VTKAKDSLPEQVEEENRPFQVHLEKWPFPGRMSKEVAKPGFIAFVVLGFYSAPQCSHCKRCTSYGFSVRHTPVLCQNDGT